MIYIHNLFILLCSSALYDASVIIDLVAAEKIGKMSQQKKKKIQTDAVPDKDTVDQLKFSTYLKMRCK